MKNHIFISYSRRNMETADAITEMFANSNIPFWIDRHGIDHVDHSFEQKIRDALDNAWGAILIATPDSRKSQYVQGELSIIKNYEIPLIVVWADGQFYTDCVPSYLTEKSYINVRGDNREEGLETLLRSTLKLYHQSVPAIVKISKNIEYYPSNSVLRFKDDTTFVIDLQRFETIDVLLYDLYMNHLKPEFTPFTYGKEWVIALSDYGNMPSVALIDAGYFVGKNRDWQYQPPAKYLLTKDVGRIVDLREDDYVFKVIQSDRDLFQSIFDKPSRWEKSLYWLKNRIKNSQPEPIKRFNPKLGRELYATFVFKRQSSDEPQIAYYNI